MTVEALAAVLRGNGAVMPWGPEQAVADVVDLAAAHGVLPLVADCVERAGERCPSHLRDGLRAAARRHVAAELVREYELRRLLAAFAGRGVRPLLMKGADLAYGAYARPDLRSRTDTDLLVAMADRAAAIEGLVALGYEAAPQSGGDLLMYQAAFRLRQDGQVVHVVDLHWRVFNAHRFGTAVSFDDFDRAAEPRPSLAAGARGLSPVHALLLACVHRVAHHYDDPRLIWLYDVRVLAARMQADDWRQFTTLAVERGLAASCVRTLETAQRGVGALVPATVVSSLQWSGGGDVDAAFLDPHAPHVRRVLSDLRHVGDWRGRWTLALQHLFPPAAYMRTVYAPASAAPLWVLYVGRLARGSRRWLGRS